MLRCSAASNKDVMHEYEDTIISSIRKALVDGDSSVRSAAAKTFDTMQHFMGAKAVDETIPTLLEAMRDPGETSETALQALQEVMSVRHDRFDVKQELMSRSERIASSPFSFPLLQFNPSPLSMRVHSALWSKLLEVHSIAAWIQSFLLWSSLLKASRTRRYEKRSTERLNLCWRLWWTQREFTPWKCF